MIFQLWSQQKIIKGGNLLKFLFCPQRTQFNGSMKHANVKQLVTHHSNTIQMYKESFPNKWLKKVRRRQRARLLHASVCVEVQSCTVNCFANCKLQQLPALLNFLWDCWSPSGGLTRGHLFRKANLRSGSKNVFDLIQKYFSRSWSKIWVRNYVSRAAKLGNICVRDDLSATKFLSLVRLLNLAGICEAHKLLSKYAMQRFTGQSI